MIFRFKLGNVIDNCFLWSHTYNTCVFTPNMKMKYVSVLDCNLEVSFNVHTIPTFVMYVLKRAII